MSYRVRDIARCNMCYTSEASYLMGKMRSAWSFPLFLKNETEIRSCGMSALFYSHELLNQSVFICWLETYAAWYYVLCLYLRCVYRNKSWSYNIKWVFFSSWGYFYFVFKFVVIIMRISFCSGSLKPRTSDVIIDIMHGMGFGMCL